MLKKLAIAAVVLILLLAAAAILALSSIDSLARRAVESGGTRALGVPTTLRSADVGLLSGRLDLAGLSIANPPPFTSPHFLTLADGGMAVSLSTLRRPTVELPTLSLKGLDLNLERREGKTNYGAILEHLKTLTGTGDKPGPRTTTNEKRFVIRDLDIQNVAVHVDLAGGPAALNQLARITVPIDRIRLTDVGRTGTGVGGTGVTLPELAGIIVRAVLAAAADKGGGLIPDDLLTDLRSRLAALPDLGELKMSVTAAAREKLDELGAKAREEGRKGLDKAADKLKDLIPKK